MKKILLLSYLAVLCLHAAAQPRFGILGGAVLAKTNGEFSDKSRAGIFLGMVMDLKLSKSVSLRPQLKYIMKGERDVSGEKGSYNYLELPINFVYNVPTKAGRFSFGLGPVVDYMISGSWTQQGGSKEKIYFNYDHVNQLDFGLNVLAGFEVKGGVFFNINYTLGLQDVWSADNIGSNKNRALGIGIGIMLDPKPGKKKT